MTNDNRQSNSSHEFEGINFFLFLLKSNHFLLLENQYTFTPLSDLGSSSARTIRDYEQVCLICGFMIKIEKRRIIIIISFVKS